MIKALVATTNFQKFIDYSNILKHWNIHAEMVDPPDIMGVSWAKSIMTDGIRFIFMDETNLHNAFDNSIINETNIAHPEAYILANVNIFFKTKIDGIVKINHIFKADKTLGSVLERSKVTDDVFGWDDIFIPSGSKNTLYELRNFGLKITGREKVIEDFLFARLSTRKDLNFSKMDGPDTDPSIDGSVYYYIFNNEIFKKILNNNNSIAVKMTKIALKNGGPFFRRKTNPKNGNYWCPGINGGIPLTPKRDETHELTYMYHDLMHHIFPDLIFDGNQTREAELTYIISRMLSEAFSLYFTDIVFIDELKSAGHEYDFYRRKIYPIYKHIMNLTRVEQIKFICDWLFLGIIEKDCFGDIDNFLGKYESYFTADFTWTTNNWNAMKNDAENYSNWINNIDPVVVKNLNLHTVSSFMIDSGIVEGETYKSIYEKVFNHWITIIDYNLSLEDTSLCVELSVSNAVKKWTLGQLFAYSKLNPISDNAPGKDILLNIVSSKEDASKDGELVKSVFLTYLQSLNITPDQAKNWSIAFPVFPPSFVSYKENKANNIKLIDILSKIQDI